MRKKTTARRAPFPEAAPPSVHDSGSPALLAAFRDLPPTALYTMAPKESVMRGYDYYRQRRLHHYVWGPKFESLAAEVQGQRTRPYRVNFTLIDGGLAASCDCPAWDPDWACKHVVCAAFTTKNLISPNDFRLPPYHEESSQVLKAELLGSAQGQGTPGGAGEVRPGFEIVIDVRPAEPVLFLRRDGMKVGWSSGWGRTGRVPSTLLPLLHAATYALDYGEDPLLRYVRQDGPYPLVLETAQGAVTLQWDPSATCRAKTVLEWIDEDVRVRAVCLVDEVEMDRFVRFRSFVIDLKGARLLRLDDDGGWNTWLAFQRSMEDPDAVYLPEQVNGGDVRVVLLPDESGVRPRHRSDAMVLTIPRHEWRTMQVDVMGQHADRVVHDLIPMVDGRPQRLLLRDPETDAETPVYRLVVRPAMNDASNVRYLLRAECQCGEHCMAPSASVFGFFPYLEQTSMLLPPLRAWKRKAILYETFLSLLAVSDVNERDRQIKAALSGADIQSRAVMKEAQWILRHALDAHTRPDLRLEVHGGRWRLRPIDKAREVLLYRIPSEVFGPEIFRGMQRCDEMAVDSSLLFERLPDLLERLTAAGIALLYEDTPVTASRWDCSVDVTRGDGAGRVEAGIDWFEIRPEIRCDGIPLDETVWRAALRQGGLIHSDRGLRVLDRSVVERLRAIVSLTDQASSPDVAGQIVRIPRLQVLDWLALRHEGVTVTLPPDDEAVLARLLGFERITPPPLPRGVQATLRPYQRDGYGWLAFLYGHRFGACLADDMGLGKTLQTICLLAAIKEGLVQRSAGVRGPHLIVVPTSLLFNWEQELSRFAPSLKVRLYSGHDRTIDAEDDEVVLTTYGLARRDIDVLARKAFHVIVFDEAQAVKNIHAGTTGAVRRLTGHFKIALTGTPLENHLGEYFSVIDLVLPGLLGEYDRFKADVKRGQDAVLNGLLRRTRPFILRRTKAQILHDLPPKIESEVFLDLTDRQKILYQQTVAQVRSTIETAYRTKTSAQAQLIAITAILKLRQVCLSPRLVTHGDEQSPKLNFLMEKLRVLLDEGHSALVFSQFTSFLDLVEEACTQRAFPYHRLDGSTAPAARKARVTAFQAGDQPGVFLLSLKAGGQGLNLTRATYVFHLDPWWNPAVENQASDRAHRIGQQRTVSIVRLLMRHSIEEKMLALKQRKRALYEAVMAGTVRGVGQGVLTRADFEYLLSPGSG